MKTKNEKSINLHTNRSRNKNATDRKSSFIPRNKIEFSPEKDLPTKPIHPLPIQFAK
jgi:hypothetical protein